MSSLLTQRLQAAKQRLSMMLGRCVLAAVNDATRLQTVTIGLLDDETKAGVERFQQYGLTSVPLPGAEGVCLFVAGNRDHGVVISIDDRRYRLTSLQAGEVALYDDQGQSVILKRDRIEVTAPTVVVETQDLRLGGAGGERVARVGDLVQVGAGSSAGTWPIITGSDRVTAT